MNLRRAGAELALTSFIVLFQELALIRWVGAEVRVLAYFPNVVLIAAFLGLGIGSMRAGKRPLLWLWPLTLIVMVGATLALGRIAFSSRSPSEHLWLLYYDIPKAPVVKDVRPPILSTFILATINFLPLGQIIGQRLQDFTRAGMPLRGYIIDLTGSLVGVIAFSALSFAFLPPTIWFAVVLIAGAALFLSRSKRLLVVHVAAAAIIIPVIAKTERNAIYSPYYALRALQTKSGVKVLANGSLHQYAAPMRKSEPQLTAYDAPLRSGYPIPYRLLRRRPRKVLVLGAGSGNDVAVALENGAERVDAVEIDPIIIRMGGTIHPDRPYLSPRVRLINDDARAFLRNTTEQYDLIVFGTLDSMTRLSALANVRLDNFVYTVEGIRSARAHLTPDGGIALYFMIGGRDIHEKLLSMLIDAFGDAPTVIQGDHRLFNEIFLAGPAWSELKTPLQKALTPEALRSVASLFDVPTDDWPYLYLESRRISGFYWSLAIAFSIIAIAMIALLAPEMRRTRQIDLEMFLFGVAFLVLETKLVTQMSLVWGTTWITSAVVFASILFMILVGTIAMQYLSIPYRTAASALSAALLLTYFTPTSWLLVRNVPARLALSVLFAGAPVLFASICFALRFKMREEPNLAFGWNLAGAVAGGLIEILAVVVGLRALTLIALVAYLASFLTLQRRALEVSPAEAR